MFHQYVIPGNGEVPNTYGDDTVNPGGAASERWSTRPPRPTTSGPTRRRGAPICDVLRGHRRRIDVGVDTHDRRRAFALLLSWGLEAADRHLIASPLTNDEAIQVMRATADPIINPNLSWPVEPRGTGTCNTATAAPTSTAPCTAVADDDIPPTASFSAPDWYSLLDPTTTSSVPINPGDIAAPSLKGYHYTLEYGLGPQPDGLDDDQQRIEGPVHAAVCSGHCTCHRSHRRSGTHRSPPSKTKTDETNDEYTVTLRLRATDSAGRMGEDRRAIAVQHDPSQLPGFPIKTGSDGISQPALVDLQGSGHIDIVWGDADGVIHARRSRDGQGAPRLAGHDRRHRPRPLRIRASIHGHEPVIAPIAVGDLLHTGGQDVVADLDDGPHLRVGCLRPPPPPAGPTRSASAAIDAAGPAPRLDYTRLAAHQGAMASPVLVSLTGGPQLDIVQAVWDGDVYGSGRQSSGAGGVRLAHCTSRSSVLRRDRRPAAIRN